MIKPDPYAFATLEAEKIIKGVGISTLPVDPMMFARERGIEVVSKPMSDAGVSGMLVRFGNKFAIAYATHFDNEGFENFSVAHELGHYFLPGHPEAIIAGENGSHESRAGFTSVDKYEVEADRFAAGFLMPRQLFIPALVKVGSGFKAIEELAHQCKTSLHATAIRFAQCCKDPVAVIVSNGSVIDHCFMSEALKNIDGIDWPKKRENLPRDSATFAFNQNSSNVRNSVRVEDTSSLQQWFGGRRNIEICEDIVGLGRYGKTLTVLYDIDIPEPDEEADEESLFELWTPRFKR